MPLSWNEIKSRALKFSKEWSDAANEDSQAKPFLISFFEVFGITNRRVATFEHAVKKYDGRGKIDLFWPGILLVEMKSRGKDLDRAFTQAMDYFPGIKERELPRYVLVCDFSRFRLHDLSEDAVNEFELADLYKNVRLFGFIAGYQTQVIKAQDPINIRAAERMGKLHDQLKEVGYVGRPLELYLVRLLFCLFADDTGIFEKNQFQEYIELRTSKDGSDLAHHISSLFHVLNTPEESRLRNLDEALAEFPYINGKLFSDHLPPASFDSAMRESLLDLCALDWGIISPAIFGSLFQSIMDAKARRNLGAHYTSEENILKLIKPLFLDELHAEFEKIKNNRNKLVELHNKLRDLKFFDPACGCGNFLVITYRELRLLELEVLRALFGSGQQMLDIDQVVSVDVDQFYGIEIEDFPAQIAQVALWLTDHQMNTKVSEEFGSYFVRIPLSHSATIVHDNALRIDWNDVLPAEQCSYVLGNPPFVGKKEQSPDQKKDLLSVCDGIKSAGILDLVAAWYVKVAQYMQRSPAIRAALVSTNSITQGEQVGVLWRWLLDQGIKIHFAHRTFAWSNEARGKAAVHCVIIGFGLKDVPEKIIFEYESIKGAAHAIKASNINPYLVDATDVFISKRRIPISPDIPLMAYGSMPIDNGNLSLTASEASSFISTYPNDAPFIRPYMGAEEFINSAERYCLWLVEASPSQLRTWPRIMDRIDTNRNFRLSSNRPQTVALADTPTLFGEIRQPQNRYLFVPKVSSENRSYMPVGLCDPLIIASGSGLVVDGAKVYHFGLIQSVMHMSWMRAVCGRMKSDYQYSAMIVYNNFPWPELGDSQKNTIEAAAQGVLDARKAHPDASLADLYDPLTMPLDLVKAHQVLDRAVDLAYGYKGASTDAARVAFLFERYRELTSDSKRASEQ